MSQATILIVDDEPPNLAVLSELLNPDFRVLACKSGEHALQIAARDPRPDLILLDIMMPGMDGYEVLTRLRVGEATRDIPVMFVTALGDSKDEEKGLKMGAVDYITKPYHPAIVKARVQNTLELKQHRDHLSALVAERTRELTEANNRLKAIDEARIEYLAAISHELRTPMNGILGVAELALEELSGETHDLYMDIYRVSRNRIMTALDSALRLAELQGEAPSIETIPIDLGALVSDTLGDFQEAFSAKELSIHLEPTKPGLVLGDEAFLQQSIATLLKSILKMAARGTDVYLRYSPEAARIVLRIAFQATSFPEKLRATFFHTFSYDRASSLLEDLGLSLPLAAHMIKAMGGQVDIREAEQGMEIAVAMLKPDSSDQHSR